MYSSLKYIKCTPKLCPTTYILFRKIRKPLRNKGNIFPSRNYVLVKCEKLELYRYAKSSSSAEVTRYTGHTRKKSSVTESDFM